MKHFARFLVLFLTLQICGFALVEPIQAQNEQFVELVRLGRSGLRTMSWSLDGTKVALAGSAGIWIYTPDFQDIALLPLPTSGYHSVSSLEWSPDGQRLAAAIYSMDESIFQIWDANNFTLLTTFTDERHDMPIIGWSPDGTRIVTSTTFGIRIRDAADGQILRSLEGHTRPIFAFSWNPNNSRLASISADSSVRIWDTGSGATIATFSLNEPGTTIAWDPSGGLLAGGTGQNIQVWDAISLTPVTLLQAHTNVVFDLDWSSYGLASTGVDDSVKVWNTNTWQIASELQVAPNSAAYINWNRTNGYLAILGFDSLVRIWDPATNSVISRAC